MHAITVELDFVRHAAPSGGASTNFESCGAMKRGGGTGDPGITVRRAYIAAGTRNLDVKRDNAPFTGRSTN
jgi:hypothetical protein